MFFHALTPTTRVLMIAIIAIRTYKQYSVYIILQMSMCNTYIIMCTRLLCMFMLLKNVFKHFKVVLYICVLYVCNIMFVMYFRC